MGKTYDALNEDLITFIKAQKLFFVATAPLQDDGHVNVSPKGYDCLKIIDEKTIAWLDLGGSGIETQAHLQENGRITLMFCAFEGKAFILRLFGQGEAVSMHDPGFAELKSMFPKFTKARAIIKVKLTRIQDSCGWGVPFFDFKEEREQLNRWCDKMSEQEYAERRYSKNAISIDGLPGLVRPPENR